MPDCTTCTYYRKSGNLATCECPDDDCSWELKKPTLAEAMKITECIDIDYGNANEHQIEEIDTALDVIFDFCRKLREYGSINDKTKLTVNHFSHNYNPLQSELEAYFTPHDIAVGYDGMEISYGEE